MSASATGFVLIGIALWVLVAIPLDGVVTKLGGRGNLAYVPFANLATLLNRFELPVWWSASLLVPPLGVVVWVVLSKRIAREFGRGAGTTVGLVLVAPVFLSILWRTAEPIPRAAAAPAAVMPASMAEAALATRAVSVRFGGVAALREVSIEAPSGTITGLIGPNGAGKTTFFNVITGLQRPDHGDVIIGGRMVTQMRPHRRARQGLARTFQRLELFTTLSVLDNVRVGLESGSVLPAFVKRRARRLTGEKKSSVDAARVLLERVGLGEMADKPVGALPTGSARLVELARALAINPRVLLLDEPCSGLDENETKELGELLERLAEGGTAIVLVEHDIDLVARICSTVYVLEFGEVIAHGTPEAIRADPVVQSAYLGRPEDAA